MPDRVFIGIGTNLGDRAANYREAITRIASLPDTRVIRQSSVYETEPVGDATELMGLFLNGVIEIQTELQAESLMQRLLAIERKPSGPAKHKPRVIDLDLLFFNSAVRDTQALTLPHPRLHERRFVLAPMTELAPTLNHPKLNVTISDLLVKLKSPHRVTLARADLMRPQASRWEAGSR
jgi:2-amino-4-hydroxy-6-hydroxymethyldihydropteridine diphosphokinase